MKYMRRIACSGTAAFAVLAGTSCRDTAVEPGPLPFGVVGEVEVHLVTPLLQGEGRLEQSLTWSSDGPWRVSERIAYARAVGDENTWVSKDDPTRLANSYGAGMLQVHSAAVSPFEVDTSLNPDCGPVKTRLTLVIADYGEGKSKSWIRCVEGTLGTLVAQDAGPDLKASRVATAAGLLRDWALVQPFAPCGLLSSVPIPCATFHASYPFAVIERGDHTPASLDGPRAIVDQQTWRQFWSQHAGASAVPPAVDFVKQVVIVAAVGVRREAGDSIEVRRVLPVGEGTVVQLALRRPGAFCSPAERSHVPYHIVVAPRVPLPITFQKPVLEEHVPCGV